MPHLVQTMAYEGTTPWHQLGNALPPNQSIETWARTAGMDWTICETPVQYSTEDSNAEPETTSSNRSFPEHKVLYRSDTRCALSVVSGRYQVVQPKAVLEFYRDLTEISGYELRRPVYSRLAGSSGPWRAPARKPRSRARMWSRATCSWPPRVTAPSPPP